MPNVAYFKRALGILFERQQASPGHQFQGIIQGANLLKLQSMLAWLYAVRSIAGIA